MRHFWEYHRKGWARRHWKSWYFWATHSRLEPVIEAARTLKRQDGLLSFFAHRVTNAAAEGLNARIQAIRVSAHGYRNRQHFKTAIYFHCGGLALHPQTHSNSRKRPIKDMHADLLVRPVEHGREGHDLGILHLAEVGLDG